MRCFVVGNGPSLADTDLNKLQGEVTFATNNVHLIYPFTSWRPNYYLRAEEVTLKPETWIESMQTHLELGCEIYCNNYFFHSKFGLQRTNKVHIIKSCIHYARHFDNPDVPCSWHLPVLCTFGSSVNVAIQLAYLQGYSPIYLVGCDLGYRNNQPSHFSPEYEHGQEQDARYANLDTLAAHMIASRSGAQIYNATVGGELEAYERVSYDSLW